MAAKSPKKTKVILLEKISGLGDLGDMVEVRPGYARNFLIPQGKAVPATPEHVARFEERRAELERKAQEALARAEARKAEIEQIGEITIAQRAGPEGRLYGSVGPAAIVEALAEKGVEVKRSEIRLPEGRPIRQLGEHEVVIHLHPDVDARLRVVVEAEVT